MREVSIGGMASPIIRTDLHGSGHCTAAPNAEGSLELCNACQPARHLHNPAHAAFNGFRTLEATTAEQGIALAIDHGPWLILMDIQLPDMDGVAALGRLRAEPVTAGIQVVALTAFAMKEDRDRFLAAGFDGYLAEPIDVQAFPQQIRGFCRHAPGRPCNALLGTDGERWLPSRRRAMRLRVVGVV